MKKPSEKLIDRGDRLSPTRLCPYCSVSILMLVFLAFIFVKHWRHTRILIYFFKLHFISILINLQMQISLTGNLYLAGFKEHA